MRSNFLPRSRMSASAKPDQQDILADDFWRYSVRLYGRPGVGENCLRLQDEAGVDVNVMLFCYWMGFRAARSLSTEDVRGLLEATGDWREGAVKPIRCLRRKLKALTADTPGSGFVYDAIKRCELAAERVKQRLLVGAAGAMELMNSQSSDAAQVALANIGTYFAAQGVGETDWVKAAVAAINNAAADLAKEETPN